MTLPDLNISISRFYPFRRKKMVGDEKWYEKIAMSYTGHISNSINTKEDKLMHSSLIKDWRNGWQHQIPVSAIVHALQISQREPIVQLHRPYVYQQGGEIMGCKPARREKCDTIYGFNNVYNWNMSIGSLTKLYGFWIPNRKLFGNRIAGCAPRVYADGQLQLCTQTSELHVTATGILIRRPMPTETYRW